MQPSASFSLHTDCQYTENPRPRAQRTLTLIAKSLQGLANMSTFGAKEPWMEPMNTFLQTSRPEFKAFVDKICSVPSERPSQAVSASYATPIQILGRLPQTSREGFPSLPFLIDSAKSFANLISLWLQKHPDNLGARMEKEHTLRKFHELCIQIQQRTKECLSKAEPAERPSGGLELEWERLLEDRDRYGIFGDDSLSPTFPPTSDGVSGSSRTDSSRRRTSNSFFVRPPTPPFVPRANNEREPDRQRGSTLVSAEQTRPLYSGTRTGVTRESASSSKNSSSLSLEATESSRLRSNTANRDGPSKNRFKDLVGVSARRRMREGVHLSRSEERSGF